ncbi:MAG: hypothetical protein M1833_000584 [Piccolia ochrophora]|nr:MAG: hypothetical protein M1833_000584 [Piccolia ochrophora]
MPFWLQRCVSLLEKIWRPELAHDALNGSHNPSAKALLATRAALNSLASRVKFQWFDIPERIFGMTDEGSDGKSARVVLQKGYHDFFQNEFLNASLEQQHRASLAFAVTLTHELAHAVYLILRCGSINVPEPYFSPADPVNELGSACISSLFNVEIQPINMLFSAKDGLSCHRWADRYRPGPLTHHAVPIGWVCSLFDERTWQRIRREGKGELAVPIGNLSSMAPLTEDFQGLS